MSARRVSALLLALALAACGSSGSSTPAKGAADGGDAATTDAHAGATIEAGAADAPSVTHPAPPGPGAVLVHLFEWRWTDIAKECEAYLGPAGFTGVQVSPPSEHAVLARFPWWQRYQTVSYALDESRSGTAAEFRDMIQRCAAAGVAIYVDAVINHMTAQASGTGSHGSHFTKYAYPGLYDATDFHTPTCAIGDGDYQSAPDRVRRCELLGLADLDTGKDAVRARIADYLAALVELGVAGFRVDAAKHIAPVDLDAIVRAVSDRVGAGVRPYYYLEVIDHGGEAIRSSDYLAVGQDTPAKVDVIEFKFDAVADAFAGLDGRSVAGLRALDTSAGLLPSDRALVFVNNHDTQRASSLYYQYGAAYDLATLFLLAWPYGTPQILSSFAFDRGTAAGRDQGPPSDAAGHTRPVWAPGAAAPDCRDDLTLPAQPAGQWLCEHRRPFIARMIAFRRATLGAPVTQEWDDGGDALAFAREGKGFVVINNGASTVHRTFATSLPAGSYCDVYGGAPSVTGCTASTIVVAADGTADVTAAAGTAFALHVNALAGQ
ncbi:MAG TPA: alpha-amylase family protein [Polyangia bacterium]|jgi:alpha-amylase|nr:alpha-amylase family protein [Polyangia bacterium]